MSFADNVASRVRHGLHFCVFSLAAYIRLARVSSNVNKSLGATRYYQPCISPLRRVFLPGRWLEGGSVPSMATDATK